ncbi:hypothetical protein NGM37_21685, partial [Streptomyces sp. TRM76130]|nr:hypothetical protein [Streptomyces sp. TRM76130]
MSKELPDPDAGETKATKEAKEVRDAQEAAGAVDAGSPAETPAQMRERTLKQIQEQQTPEPGP